MFSFRRGRKAIRLALVLSLILSMGTTALAQEPGGSQDGPQIESLTPLEPESFYDVMVAKDGRAPDQGVAAADAQGRVSIIVKLADAPLATYQGGLPGLAPTNPRITGADKIDFQSAASQDYLRYLDTQQDRFIDLALQSVTSADVIHRYRTAFNGVSMILPEAEVQAVASLPGVAALYPDVLQHMDTEVSPDFIGAPVTWDALGGQESAGEGVVIGVIDSGIWPEHPSFSDPDPSGKAYSSPPVEPGSNGWGSAGPKDTCDFGDTDYNSEDAPFTCNNKLIGAYAFIDTYRALRGLPEDNYTTARDDVGHGTHTSSTAAGNAGVESELFGIDRGVISGIAPRAHLIMYRALVTGSGFASDLAAAAEQAILDGVNAINYSISGGENPYSDPVEQVFLNAYAAGVFVSTSAGNSGPTANTVAHRSPWVATVAASNTDRFFVSTATLVAENGNTLIISGASITEGIDTPTPVVFPPAGSELCGSTPGVNPFPPGTFNGEIVICRRGITARVEKSFNVAAGGGAGVLFYNPSLQGLATDNHFIPTVHFENDAGSLLVTFVRSFSGVEATFTRGLSTEVQGDVIAAFSSRGGTAQTLGVSKPDLTAPGVQILAGHTPRPTSAEGGLPGELFQAIQGTSMSSPHIAGAAALLKALHPDWTPGQIKSAMMTSAVTSVTKEDGVTPADPFDYGSGRIDLGAAGEVGLTFDETAANYLALENELWKANYPSLYVPVMPGSITVRRTVRNETDETSVWNLSVSTPEDVSVKVPEKITLQPGGKATFKITVSAPTVPVGGVRHAMIEFSKGDERLHFPITILRRQPAVTLEKTCDPASLPLGETTACTITASNNTIEAAEVRITDKLPSQLRLIPESVVGATASGRNVTFNGTLFAGQPPGVMVGPGEAPVAVYTPVDVDPVAGVTDETIVNFTTPPFRFGGATYTRIGMTSNGYAVVGGGTASDVQFLNQNLPDEERPNNVLAPFWTDLNPAAGGEGSGLRGAIADFGGGDRYLVLDWREVPEFNSGKKATFQIWISLSATEEITWVYGTVEGNGDNGLLTVGAENQFGNRGQTVYYNGSGVPPAAGAQFAVTTTPPEPGETYQITFSAEGVRTGPWTNCARMTGSVFFGTNIDCFSGEVTQEAPPGP